MNILITAPSLDTNSNVSGISSVVNNILKNSNQNRLRSKEKLNFTRTLQRALKR